MVRLAKSTLACAILAKICIAANLALNQEFFLRFLNSLRCHHVCRFRLYVSRSSLCLRCPAAGATEASSIDACLVCGLEYRGRTLDIPCMDACFWPLPRGDAASHALSLLTRSHPLTHTLSFSPANAEAASLYRENMKEYVRRVKATVEESWLDEGEGASAAAAAASSAPAEGAAAGANGGP